MPTEEALVETGHRARRPGPNLSRLLSFPTVAIAVSLALGGISAVTVRALSFDAWGWLLWGQEIMGQRPFTTDGYPSWKPLTGLIAAAITPLQDATPTVWLVIARGGAVMALFLAYRLAARLAGPVAGVLAAVALLIVPQWVFQSGLGGSEPLLTALLLGAVACHADRRDRAGFTLVLLASLLRPESWPLLLVSAVVVWRRGVRSPGGRALIVAGLVAVPVLWFGGEYLGSGDPFRGGQLAAKSSEAKLLRKLWALPGLGVLDLAWRLVPLTLLACAVPPLVKALRERDPVVLSLGLGALVWIAEIVVLAQMGYAGVGRFLFPAAAALAVVGAAGLVRLTRELPVVPRVALVAVAAALAVPSFPHALELGPAVRFVRDRAALGDAVNTIVKRMGKRAFFAGRHVVAQGETITPLAWHLGVPTATVRRPTIPALALVETGYPWPVLRRALQREGGRFAFRAVAVAPPLQVLVIERCSRRGPTCRPPWRF